LGARLFLFGDHPAGSRREGGLAYGDWRCPRQKARSPARPAGKLGALW